MGRKLSRETREKISRALKGRPKSAEHTAKNSAAKMGHVQSAETIAKRVAKNRGQRRTPEQRARQSDAAHRRERTANAAKVREEQSARRRGQSVYGTNDVSGYVYLAANLERDDGAIKIGSARCLSKRMRDLNRCGHRDFADRGDRVRLLESWYFPRYFRRVERRVHEILGIATTESPGEFTFQPRDAVISAIEQAIGEGAAV